MFCILSSYPWYAGDVPQSLWPAKELLLRTTAGFTKRNKCHQKLTFSIVHCCLADLAAWPCSWVKIQMKSMISSEPDFPPFHSRLTWFQLSTFMPSVHYLIAFFAFTYSSSKSALKGIQNEERRRNSPSTTSFLCHGAMHCAFPTAACIFCRQPFSSGSRSPEKGWKELHCKSASIVLHCFLMTTLPVCIYFWLSKWDLSYISTEKCWESNVKWLSLSECIPLFLKVCFITTGCRAMLTGATQKMIPWSNKFGEGWTEWTISLHGFIEPLLCEVVGS